MRKLFIFIGGVVTGVVLTFLVSFLILNMQSNNDGITLFEKQGECISTNSFKVLQVLDSGAALSIEMKELFDSSIPTGMTVLFLNEDGQCFYDEQIIRIPFGKCARQIGVFKYPTKSGIEKTVPIVDIRDE